MSYYTISIIAADQYVRQRVAACAAQEGVADPESWAFRNRLILAASPGWAGAWESAVEKDVEDPGKDEGVITDSAILAATQLLLKPPAPPEETA